MKPLIDEWNKYYDYHPKNILEIGSRDGADANLLQVAFNVPDDKVYIAEAHPHCVDHIRKTYPNYNLYGMAVALENGVTKFNAVFTPDLGTLGMSSLLSRTDESFPENWVDVETITGKSLMDKIGEPEIDLVKIDVEGYTYEVLKSFDNNLSRIKMMHLEVEHYPFWKNQTLYNDVCELLTQQGFEECYRFDYVYEEDKVQSDVIWRRL